MLVVAFDFRNLRNPRNIRSSADAGHRLVFLEILGFWDRLQDHSRNFMDWVFTAVVVTSVALLVRAIRRCIPAGPHVVNVDSGALVLVAVAMLANDIGTALYNPPDDADTINIGAQR